MRTTCNHCQGSIVLPERYSAATIRCTWCEAAATVPENLRSAARPFDDDGDDRELYTFVTELEPEPPKPEKPRKRPVSAVPIRAAKPVFQPAENDGPPLLVGDEEERLDGPDTPYTVPGTGLKPCPECRGELPLAATFCVHCGTPLIGPDRQAVRRTYTPVDREWHDGWAPHFRRSLFFILLGVNAAAVLLGVWVRGDNMLLGRVWLENIVFSILPVLMQAFLLGTYGTLRVIRTVEGHCEVWRTWRFAFVPLKPKLVSLEGMAGTGRVVQTTGFAEVAATMALLPLGIVPGLLFLAMVYLPVRCTTVIVDENRGTLLTVLRGQPLAEAENAASVLAEATGSTWHKVL